MSTKNEDRIPPDNMETLEQEASACGPGCCCHAGGPPSRLRWIVGLIIILAAGALVARALIKNNDVKTAKAASGFAALPAVGQAPVTAIPHQAEEPRDRLPGNATTNVTPTGTATVAVKEISALSELNAMAADADGVFVFLSGKNDPLIKAPLAQMRSAAKMIEGQGQKIGLFILKTDSPEYAQVAAQTPVPCVLAMVKGSGMAPIAGEITETKLVQGFVAASSSGSGCGPSGCGPQGCN